MEHDMSSMLQLANDNQGEAADASSNNNSNCMQMLHEYDSTENCPFVVVPSKVVSARSAQQRIRKAKIAEAIKVLKNSVPCSGTSNKSEEEAVLDDAIDYIKYLKLQLKEVRETGAHKEADDKLEKTVEEITWHLQLEKRLRTDLEEAKEQEITKLQNHLQAAQSKSDEAATPNAQLIKEWDIALKVIKEDPHVIQETQVLVQDTEKIGALNAKVEDLKASLQSGKERADELESKYTDTRRMCNEKQNKLENRRESTPTPRILEQSHRESNTLTGEERPKRDARHAGNVVGKCKILSWQKQVVAEGTIVSTDPDCLVHFEKLGPDDCKVWVDVAVDPEAFLW